MMTKPKNTISNRLFACLLAVIMVLGLLPTNMLITAQAAWSGYTDFKIDVKPTGAYTTAHQQLATYDSVYLSGNPVIYDVTVNGANGYKSIALSADHDMNVHNGTKWENENLTSVIAPVKPILDLYYWVTQTRSGHDANTYSADWDTDMNKTMLGLSQTALWMARAGLITDMNDGDQVTMLADEALLLITKLGVSVTSQDVLVLIERIMSNQTTAGWEINSNFDYYLITPDNGTDPSLLIPHFTGASTVKPVYIWFENLESDTKQPLAGSTYKIYDSNNILVSEITTTTAAKTIAGPINIESENELLTVIQTGAPTGYIPTNYGTVIVNTVLNNTSDAAAKVSGSPFYNIKGTASTTHDITLIKLDQHGNKLDGAVFNIYKDNVPLDTKSTIDGKIVLTNVTSGVYRFTEIKAPTGFILSDDNTVRISVDTDAPDKNHIVSVLNYDIPAIEVVKLDKNTKVPVPGAVFTVKINDKLVGDYSTYANGMLKVPYADYALLLKDSDNTWNVTITEKTPPDGYFSVKDSTIEKSATMTRGKVLMPYVFENYSFFGIDISKYDNGTTTLLNDASFDVYVDGIKIGTGKTGASGQLGVLTFGPNFVGQHLNGTGKTEWEIKVVETAPPTGHAAAIPTEQTQTVKIDRTGNVQFSFGNAEHPSLMIYKTDDAGNPLAGGVFDVSIDGKKVFTATTDATGYAITDALTFGTYLGNVNTQWEITVTETKAPDGYILPENNTQTQVITKGQSSVMFTFSNVEFPDIVINKIDIDETRPLAGATFEIAFDGNVFDSFVTDTDGKIVIRYHDNGATKGYGAFLATLNNPTKLDWTVTAKETHAPAGYIIPDTDSQTLAMNLNQNMVPFNFTNSQYPTIKIHVADKFDDTKSLSGVKFNITIDGTLLTKDYITAADGTISILPADYISFLSDNSSWAIKVQQDAAITGYFAPLAADKEQSSIITMGQALDTFEFINEPLPTVTVNKTSAKTGEPIAGAVFTLTRNPGGDVFTATSAANGLVTFNAVPEGSYTLKETSAPKGYVMSSDIHSVTIERSTEDKVQTINFDVTNKEVPALVIKKTDSITGDPIQGVVFKLSYSVSAGGTQKELGTFTTDTSGEIEFGRSSNLEEGFYTITELSPISGYAYSAEGPTKTIQLNANDEYVHSVTNTPLSALIIRKIDASTGKPVEGATFKVTYLGASTNTNGTIIKTAKTSVNGTIVIPGLDAGNYLIEEISPAPGYELSSPSLKQAYLSGRDQDNVEVLFGNAHKGSLTITKLDSVTKNPIQGAKFQVTDATGTPIGSNNGIFTTDENGVIEIADHLNVGMTVTVKELAPAPGYVLDTTAQNVKIKENTMSNLTFYNTPMGSLIIIKRDNATGEVLSGAQFTIKNDQGEFVGQSGGTSNSNGIFTTDANGMIVITGLTEDNYIVTETKAPEGYNLDSIPQTVRLKLNDTQTLTFYDSPKSGIQILKRDVDTKRPLAGADFTIYNTDGSIAGVYTTDTNGIIALDNLKPGWYKAVESKAPNGYLRDDAPVDFQITNNQELLLIFENVKLPGLEILKIDANTQKPIKGVQFRLYTNNQNQLIGTYTTDENGLIFVPDLKAGTYQIEESKAADGYIADSSLKTVEVKPNSTSKITIENTKAAGIVIYKIDSITGDPLPGAQFTLSDQRHNPVGVFTTDDQGRIIIDDKDFTAGRYYLRETKAPQGYNLDNQERTVTLETGKTTTITWENTAKTGSIQILKRSGDANINNGKAAGSYLEGAVFGVYSYTTGRQVTTFTSGSNGWAISKQLPLGKYVLKEIQAPNGYKLSDQEIVVELTTEGQVLKYEVLNYSANLRVSINKTGVQTATTGSNIMYYFRDIRNMSGVSLDNFYWRDVLPTDVLRANYLTTGTYNVAKIYNISVTTNLGREFTIADNLSTTKDNYVDLRAAAINLQAGEFVTSYQLNFGTVPSGFTQVTEPKLECYVLTGIQNGLYFVNKADAGGQSNGTWTVANTTWGSTIYNPTPPKNPNYPKTGY